MSRSTIFRAAIFFVVVFHKCSALLQRSRTAFIRFPTALHHESSERGCLLRKQCSWYDDDTPALPSKKKKKRKKPNQIASDSDVVESFADREERKAEKKWNKLQVKKEAKRGKRKSTRRHGKDGTMSAYLNEGKGGSGKGKDRSGGTTAGGFVELSPWEQPMVGVAGGVEGGALRLRRQEFNTNEVRGFAFVGGFDFEDLPALGLPEIAFLGRSNAGKSSMLNTLAGPGQRPALVSKMPGRTRRINLFRVADRQGDFLVVADLPGYGYAKISKEGQRGIEDFLNKYLQHRTELGLVILLVDCRLEAQEADREVLNALRTLGLRYLVVATKVDKLTSNERRDGTALETLRIGLGLAPDETPVPFSSTDIGAMKKRSSVAGNQEDEARNRKQMEKGAGGIGIADVWGYIRDAILAMESDSEVVESSASAQARSGGVIGEEKMDFGSTRRESFTDAHDTVHDYFLDEESFDEGDFDDFFDTGTTSNTGEQIGRGDFDIENDGEEGNRGKLLEDGDLFDFA